MAIINTKVHYNLAFDGGIIVQRLPVCQFFALASKL